MMIKRWKLILISTIISDRTKGPVHVTVNGKCVAKHIGAQLETAIPFADVLNGLNGNFAVAVDSPGALHLGVDVVRSIPLFYRQDGDLLTASDELGLLLERDDPMDERSAVEAGVPAWRAR